MEDRSYYRLKQTDYNGIYKFSEIRTVRFEESPELEFVTFPNPVRNHEFSIEFYSQLETETQISLYRLIDEIIFTQTIKPGVSNYNVNLHSGLSAGVYFLKALNQRLTSQKKIIIE